MRYQKYQPDVALRPFVECYFVWGGEAKETVDVQSPPNSFNALVLNYADSYEAYQNSTERMSVPNAFVCGIFTSNYHLVLRGNIGMIGIVFKPPALFNFFGIHMSKLVNNRLALELLLPDKAPLLLKEIKAASTDEDRVKILEEFALQFLGEAKARRSVVDEAVELINEHRGCISVEAVSAHLKISRRYLEKHFLEKVGVSPKFYSRIKRFVTLSKTVAYSEKFDWQDIVFENGLHDQSHLAKEFLEFNRMSPSEYFEKHQELIRLIKPR